MSRLAYLARPLDFAEPARQQVERVRVAIGAADYTLYDPGAAFTLVGASFPDARTASGINSVNEAALLAAGLLVALVPQGDTRSVGVPAEIALAISWGMNVLLVIPSGAWQGVTMSGWAHDLAEAKRGGFTDLDGLYAEIRLLDARA